MSPHPPLVPVSWGELLDKISILEIKAERIADPARRANVGRELRALARARDEAAGFPGRPGGPAAAPAGLDRLVAELRRVNETLWDVEDEIRLAERAGDFGPRFVALARSVYRTNDRRAALKRSINDLLGSRLVEEKSYADYAPGQGGGELAA
jgi:hypothetical protein